MKHKLTAIVFAMLSADALATGEASTCDAKAKKKVAVEYVASRYCGTSFDDLRVLYDPPGVRDLMPMLRDPVVPGHFMVSVDALVLAGGVAFEEMQDVSEESWVYFRFQRLGASEGSGNHRVFIADSNEQDQFRLKVNNRCEIMNPPVARVHPRYLYTELTRRYSKLKEALGDRCEDHLHCKVLRLQIDSLEFQWPDELRKECKVH